MTSYEFEKAAKNAVIMTLNEDININELDIVWFAHELGYKKCTIWGRPMGNRYIKDSDVKISSTRKYICPCCGNSFRATKNINVMCMDCNEQFVLE